MKSYSEDFNFNSFIAIGDEHIAITSRLKYGIKDSTELTAP